MKYKIGQLVKLKGLTSEQYIKIGMNTIDSSYINKTFKIIKCFTESVKGIEYRAYHALDVEDNNNSPLLYEIELQSLSEPRTIPWF